MTNIDIIVYHLNYGQYLYECLESIRKQDVPKTVYLMDGGSTDSTWEVLKGFPEVQVHIIKGYVATSINYGLTNSSGDYTVCFASDNVMFPNFLSKAKQVLDENIDVGLVYGGAAEIDEHSQKRGILPFGGPFDRKRLLDANFIDFSMGVFRKSCQKEIGLFPEEICYHLDWYLWIKISEKWRVHDLGCPVIYYRVHPESQSSKKKLEIIPEYIRLKTKIDEGKL